MEKNSVKENEIKSEGGENSSIKAIVANVIDQVILAAISAILLFLCDFILKMFGYMFIRDMVLLMITGGVVYFILNCIYEPIMKKTIAKRILNIN